MQNRLNSADKLKFFKWLRLEKKNVKSNYFRLITKKYFLYPFQSDIINIVVGAGANKHHTRIK